MWNHVATTSAKSGSFERYNIVILVDELQTVNLTSTAKQNSPQFHTMMAENTQPQNTSPTALHDHSLISLPPATAGTADVTL